MTNLLTDKDKLNLKKERRARLVNVALIFFSVAFWICSLALAPKAFLIFREYQKLEADLLVTKSNPEAVSFLNLQKVVSLTKKQIDSADVILNTRPYISKILPGLLADKPKGVSITSISFTKGDKENALYINGTANSRDALRQFSTTLKSNTLFASVDVPVASFAKAKENDFSITLKLSSKNGK